MGLDTILYKCGPHNRFESTLKGIVCQLSCHYYHAGYKVGSARGRLILWVSLATLFRSRWRGWEGYVEGN
jgi:hypothetical protein